MLHIPFLVLQIPPQWIPARTLHMTELFHPQMSQQNCAPNCKPFRNVTAPCNMAMPLNCAPHFAMLRDVAELRDMVMPHRQTSCAAFSQTLSECTIEPCNNYATYNICYIWCNCQLFSINCALNICYMRTLVIISYHMIYIYTWNVAPIFSSDELCLNRRSSGFPSGRIVSKSSAVVAP